MPTPKNVHIKEIDLDAPSTGRPESGVLHRERVRHDVMQLTLTFVNMTAEKARLIRHALAPPKVTVQFWMFDELETRTMYAGDRDWDEWFDDSGEAHISLQLSTSEY